MPKQQNHADPATFLGQLQRGRGEGYRGCLVIPKRDAHEALIDCICNDPRLDSQIEDRAPYYAAIAIETEFELEPILEYVRKYDADDEGWDTPLAIGTLSELAKRGHKDAAQMLCDYLAWGQWWDYCLDDLCAVQDSGLHLQIAQIIERRFPLDSELEETLDWFYLDSEPWTTLARHSARISDLKNKSNKRAQTAGATLFPSNLESFNTTQLLKLAEHADAGNCYQLRRIMKQVVLPSDVDLLKESVSLERPFRAAVALTGLAKLAPVSIFSWLSSFYLENPRMPAYLRGRIREVMAALPSNLTLPLAREHLHHHGCHERYPAEHIFEAHAPVEDIPLLRNAIGKALQDDEDNCYRLCTLAEAFYNLPNSGPIPELTNLFIQFRYSFGRTRVAKVIQVTAPDFFRENFASECLWDCEEGTRLIAAQTVSINKETNNRLQCLASDLWEDNEIRAEAERRLSVLHALRQ
jgi:hypothetical protein